MHDSQCTYFNRIGPGNNVSTFQNNVSRAREEITDIKNINQEVFKIQNKYKKIQL